ncbi:MULTISPECIES: flagellar motor switch protein FliM [Kordiimonas]|jgi:flagellar motor switch protein FliM|uniref:Flagellar motor switch protein FliM n=1 Tax=Kordiimonas lacus TaxID=637679 RepID=A0A1G6VZW0_9PROT|nr:MULTISPECIES: flagellar motor switch protein FliM [Kordiimonas]SDD59064.1 flagellar motor switch protein FliM [Kordiimonas lacus]
MADDEEIDDEAVAAEWAAMAGGDDDDENAADQDEMAAEWEAMAAGGDDEDDDGSGPSPGRVLDQDEIDSLLGFDGDGDSGEMTGIHALINSALVSYERLPMLDIIFDRMVRMMSTSLRNFTSDNIEVSLDNITSVRFGDYLNSIPLPAMLAVFRAEEWDNYGLMTIDSSLIYSIVDVLLGGRRGTAAMRIEGRPYTTIEQTLVERMISVVLKDMCGAFEPLSPVNFTFDRLETNPRFATIARPPNAAILIKLRVDMEDRGGRLEVLFPYATLEPVRELLLQRFMGEKFGRDSIWETHLATELWRADVDLQAIMDETTMSLRDVMNFEVGQTILFNKSPNDEVVLKCGEVPMVSGAIGRAGQHVAVQIRQTAERLHVEDDPNSGSY